jgi:Uma2 family endonuclease
MSKRPPARTDSFASRAWNKQGGRRSIDSFNARFYRLPMLAPVHPAVTRSDYEALPAGPPYYQLIEGQLVMSPSPFTKHQRVVGRLFGILSAFVQEHTLGEVFVAPLDVFLNDVNVYQPDIAYVSTAQMHIVTDHGIEGAPDLCVEVLSKSTQRFDKITKKKVFAQAGLHHYWLVDTETHELTAFDLLADSETAAQVLKSPAIFRPPLFPQLEINLRQIFA